MSKKLFLANGLLALLISGCLGTGVETPVTKALKDNAEANRPTIEVGVPNVSSIRSVDTVNFILIVEKADISSITDDEVGLVYTGTAAGCDVVMAYAGELTRVSLSGCLGNGTVRIYIKAGALKSSLGSVNVQTTTSAAVTVDNLGPLLSASAPASGPVASIPSSFTLTFSEPVDVSTITVGLFTVGGTCSVRPTIGTRTPNGSRHVFVVVLSGAATCTNGQTVTIQFNKSTIRDDLGNTGSSITLLTYTFTTGPTVSFGAFSPTTVNAASAAASITATYTSSTTPTINASTITLVGTGGATCATIAGSAVGLTSANILLSGCTGTGTVRVRMNADTIENASGIGNALTSPSGALTVDNTGPTVSSLTPATGTIGSVPANFVATFNEAVDPTTVTAVTFALTGTTCTIDPIVGTPVMSVGNTVATAPITGGTCVNGEIIRVSVDPTTVKDTLGTFGAAGTVTRNLTMDTVKPTVTFDPPSSTLVRSAVNIGVTFNNADISPTVNGTTVELDTAGAACTTIAGSGVSAAGATINITGCTGDGTIRARFLANSIFDNAANGNLVTAWSDLVTIDNTGPTIAGALPATSTVAAQVANIAVTYDEALNAASVVSTDFTVGGASTCTTSPVPGTPVMSAGDTVATVPLGGNCLHGETLIINSNGSAVTDVAGNVGTGSISRTYTFDLQGPTVVITGLVATNATVRATFSEPVSNMTVGKFTIAGCVIDPIATAYTVVSPTQYDITLDDSAANCAASTLTVSVDTTTVTDVLGNAGTTTGSQSFP